MAKLKLEKATGVVALAYLIIIPAAGIVVWNRLLMLENEMADIWHHLDEKKSRSTKYQAGPGKYGQPEDEG